MAKVEEFRDDGMTDAADNSLELTRKGGLSSGQRPLWRPERIVLSVAVALAVLEIVGKIWGKFGPTVPASVWPGGWIVPIAIIVLAFQLSRRQRSRVAYAAGALALFVAAVFDLWLQVGGLNGFMMD